MSVFNKREERVIRADIRATGPASSMLNWMLPSMLALSPSRLLPALWLPQVPVQI